MRSGLKTFFYNLLSNDSYTHSDWDKQHLEVRSWRAFERLVALLWNDMGYDTDLLQGKRDGGIDVIAEQTNRIPFSNPQKIAIQAKKWSGKIPEPTIRDLFGVQKGGHRHSSTDKFDESILVTSSGCSADKSGFTRGARQFAKDNQVELIDGETLLSLLNESNLSPLSLGRKPGQKWHFRESPCCGWSNKFSQNQTYSQTAEKVFDGTTRRIEPTCSGVAIVREDLCEKCMNLRLD